MKLIIKQKEMALKEMKRTTRTMTGMNIDEAQIGRVHEMEDVNLGLENFCFHCGREFLQREDR